MGEIQQVSKSVSFQKKKSSLDGCITVNYMWDWVSPPKDGLTWPGGNQTAANKDHVGRRNWEEQLLSTVANISENEAFGWNEKIHYGNESD